MIEDVLYESIKIVDPIWIPVYVGPQQMFHVTNSACGSCMADPLACVTEPKVAVTRVILRDVDIVGGFTPNVILCDSAAPCEDVVLQRVTRSGWPMGAKDWFGRRDGYMCRHVRGKQIDSKPVPPVECLEEE